MFLRSSLISGLLMQTIREFREPCHAQVLVEAAAGIPSDAVLSLRLGPTRRQAPLLRGAKFDVKVFWMWLMWRLELDPFKPIVIVCSCNDY
jgi:hypothetical protein